MKWHVIYPGIAVVIPRINVVGLYVRSTGDTCALVEHRPCLTATCSSTGKHHLNLEPVLQAVSDVMRAAVLYSTHAFIVMLNFIRREHPRHTLSIVLLTLMFLLDLPLSKGIVNPLYSTRPCAFSDEMAPATLRSTLLKHPSTYHVSKFFKFVSCYILNTHCGQEALSALNSRNRDRNASFFPFLGKVSCCASS